MRKMGKKSKVTTHYKREKTTVAAGTENSKRLKWTVTYNRNQLLVEVDCELSAKPPVPL